MFSLVKVSIPILNGPQKIASISNYVNRWFKKLPEILEAQLQLLKKIKRGWRLAKLEKKSEKSQSPWGIILEVDFLMRRVKYFKYVLIQSINSVKGVWLSSMMQT